MCHILETCRSHIFTRNGWSDNGWDVDSVHGVGSLDLLDIFKTICSRICCPTRASSILIPSTYNDTSSCADKVRLRRKGHCTCCVIESVGSLSSNGECGVIHFIAIYDELVDLACVNRIDRCKVVVNLTISGEGHLAGLCFSFLPCSG